MIYPSCHFGLAPRSIAVNQTGPLLQGDLVGGGGEGDLVPGLEVKRRFSSLLSHAHKFMEDSERRDNIEFLYTQVPISNSF